jgi:hypothetical protein
MGRRKIIVKQTAADNIAAISWFIESKGLVATAEKFADNVYDYFTKIADVRKSYPLCRHSERALLGFKCVPYRKKYTIVFIETKREIMICEFISSKLIRW